MCADVCSTVCSRACLFWLSHRCLSPLLTYRVLIFPQQVCAYVCLSVSLTSLPMQACGADLTETSQRTADQKLFAFNGGCFQSSRQMHRAAPQTDERHRRKCSSAGRDSHSSEITTYTCQGNKMYSMFMFWGIKLSIIMDLNACSVVLYNLWSGGSTTFCVFTELKNGWNNCFRLWLWGEMWALYTHSGSNPRQYENKALLVQVMSQYLLFTLLPRLLSLSVELRVGL